MVGLPSVIEELVHFLEAGFILFSASCVPVLRLSVGLSITCFTVLGMERMERTEASFHTNRTATAFHTIAYDRTTPPFHTIRTMYD